ncbi:hypothetical protein FHR32_006496 [Streptosporangium album]|uniref:Uncharacterized protein n=1 Tax=Streptosporangium album TaxID=47479 RepID=A0A7W7S1M3_9ACTN|nr:hypothetical protein [Streptosporangium album]
MNTALSEPARADAAPPAAAAAAARHSTWPSPPSWRE